MAVGGVGGYPWKIGGLSSGYRGQRSQMIDLREAGYGEAALPRPKHGIV